MLIADSYWLTRWAAFLQHANRVVFVMPLWAACGRGWFSQPVMLKSSINHCFLNYHLLLSSDRVWCFLITSKMFNGSMWISPCWFSLLTLHYIFISLVFVHNIALMLRLPVIDLTGLTWPHNIYEDTFQFNWLFIRMSKGILFLFFYWTCISIIVNCIIWKGWAFGCLYMRCESVTCFFTNAFISKNYDHT